MQSLPVTQDRKIMTSPAPTGILLINLGTPEATSRGPMRAYLKEFLSDPRVIETNRALWWLILNGIILNVRPKKSGHAYEQIWNKQLDESPLKTYTRSQAEKLAERFAGQPLVVDWAMRYGKPAIAEGMKRLMQKGCKNIVIFPMYPQYAAATTASVFDKVAEAMSNMRAQPTLRFVPPFPDDDSYISALATRFQQHLSSLEWTPEKILISYHGLPQSYIDKGDPYYDHCMATTSALRDKMGMNENQMIATFQSRVGRHEWIKPYTDATVNELAQSGVKNLVLLSPAFISDCVETLEELAIGLKTQFLNAGGNNFSVAPCLNDSNEAIDMLHELTSRNLAGWI